MNEAVNPRAIIGANFPPPVDPELLEREDARVRAFADAAGEFLDLKEIASAEQAARLKDCLDGARGVYKQVDAARKDAKQPHADAAAAVDKAFRSALLTIENAIAKLKPLQTDWLRREETRLAKEKAEAQRRAQEAQEAAERLRLEAEARNDVVGITAAAMAAEEAAAQAKAAERDRPARIESATGEEGDWPAPPALRRHRELDPGVHGGARRARGAGGDRGRPQRPRPLQGVRRGPLQDRRGRRARAGVVVSRVYIAVEFRPGQRPYTYHHDGARPWAPATW